MTKRRRRKGVVRSSWCIDEDHAGCTYSGCGCDCHEGVPPVKPAMTPGELAAHPTYKMLKECQDIGRAVRRDRMEERERRRLEDEK